MIFEVGKEFVKQYSNSTIYDDKMYENASNLSIFWWKYIKKTDQSKTGRKLQYL